MGSRSASPPHLDLSNRYTGLSDDTMAHSGHPAVTQAAPTRPVLDPSPSMTPADNVTSSLWKNIIQAGGPSTLRLDRRPLTEGTLSSRCKMLRDAILRRSGCLPRTEPRGDPPSGLKAPGPPSHHPLAQADHRRTSRSRTPRPRESTAVTSLSSSPLLPEQ